MSTKPLRYCAVPQCPNKVTSGRCPAHAIVNRHERRRFSIGQTHYGIRRWMATRDRFRADHPFCINAQRHVPRCTLVTEVVDHIVPHRGDERLMYDLGNLQPMCKACHDAKTASETFSAHRAGP